MDPKPKTVERMVEKYDENPHPTPRINSISRHGLFTRNSVDFGVVNEPEDKDLRMLQNHVAPGVGSYKISRLYISGSVLLRPLLAGDILATYFFTPLVWLIWWEGANMIALIEGHQTIPPSTYYLPAFLLSSCIAGLAKPINLYVVRSKARETTHDQLNKNHFIALKTANTEFTENNHQVDPTRSAAVQELSRLCRRTCYHLIRYVHYEEQQKLRTKASSPTIPDLGEKPHVWRSVQYTESMQDVLLIWRADLLATVDKFFSASKTEDQRRRGSTLCFSNMRFCFTGCLDCATTA